MPTKPMIAHNACSKMTEAIIVFVCMSVGTGCGSVRKKSRWIKACKVGKELGGGCMSKGARSIVTPGRVMEMERDEEQIEMSVLFV